jgi:hypothetical protein
MPDDIPPLGERCYEPRLATEAGLEFIMGQVAALPTRRELIRFGVWLCARVLRARAGRPAHVMAVCLGMQVCSDG